MPSRTSPAEPRPANGTDGDQGVTPQRLKSIFFFVGLAAGALVVAVEIGSHALTGGSPAAAQFTTQAAHLLPGTPPIDPAGVKQPPGMAISYLALVDGFLLFVLTLEGLTLVVSQRTVAKVQGIVTLIVSLLWMIASHLDGDVGAGDGHAGRARGPAPVRCDRPGVPGGRGLVGPLHPQPLRVHRVGAERLHPPGAARPPPRWPWGRSMSCPAPTTAAPSGSSRTAS